MTKENAGTAHSPTILYEDDDVVVIDKPSGAMVHADGHNKDTTVADWFVQTYPDVQGVGESMQLHTGETIERPGVVHRLDTETSGVLLLVKNQEAFEYIKKQFHDRQAKKEYRAFVYGRMQEDHGTVDRAIGRSAKDHRLRSAQRGAKGTLRNAKTDWEVIAQNNEYAYLRIMPKTGRTHQIRVHMKAIHHPVVCDALYAPKHASALGFNRLALHAYRLTVILPSGAETTFEAPLPQVFQSAEEQLRT